MMKRSTDRSLRILPWSLKELRIKAHLAIGVRIGLMD